MTFTSYAQNFEDVMLWRALRHVPQGRYIDVGAHDPVIDSVSKGFHEQGWRGMHVEPSPTYVERLRADRPDEIVVPVALSASAEGTVQFFHIEGTGLSTANAEVAQRQRERGFHAEAVTVSTMTLAQAAQAFDGLPVHWLKVDVEGFEAEVLRGWDSEALRPWVLVVEATAPSSTEEQHADWEPLVLGAGYGFVYFDGLNRFYVADEHAELAAAFRTPPNVFDGVELSGLSTSSWCRRFGGASEESHPAAGTVLQRASAPPEPQAEASLGALVASVGRFLGKTFYHRPKRSLTKRWRRLKLHVEVSPATPAVCMVDDAEVVMARLETLKQTVRSGF